MRSRMLLAGALVVAVGLSACSGDDSPRSAHRPSTRTRTSSTSPAAAPDGGSTTTTPATNPPSPPSIEDERPLATYPTPQVPASGCPSASGEVVTITFGGDHPDPACASVRASQVLRVANSTTGELGFNVGERQEVINAGDAMELGPAGQFLAAGRNYFWVSAQPQLSGILELVA